jgi:glutamate N-acetyltransferase/amino-acid N-acetyltransferase
MCQLAAQAVGVSPEQVLVASTGVIGQQLPMDRIERGLSDLAARLSDSPDALLNLARGIMTTDTVPKFTTRTLHVGPTQCRLAAVAKGAGMIGPNMATMLCFIMCDAWVEPQQLQRILRRAVEQTFNRISVEGHTSTNDTVLMLANGAARGEPLQGVELSWFAETVQSACAELAEAIARDGEGARHLIVIDVEGLRTECEADQIARAVANSPLVKTAIAGADPNWGRIVSAAGYAGVPFDQDEVRLWFNNVLLFDAGRPTGADERPLAEQMGRQREVHIRLSFARGSARCRFWTSDLTEEYVRANAEYRT